MPERGDRGSAWSSRPGRAHPPRRPRARRAAAVLASAASLLLAANAWADDVEEFEIGKNRFDAGQYEEAASRFGAMLDPRLPPCTKVESSLATPCRLSDPDLVERARAFRAASLIALDRGGEADVQIERLLRANPAYTPSPATFPPDVLDRFSAVRSRLRQELEEIARQKAERERQARLAAQRESEAEERRVAELERLASEERVVRANSRFIALLPFGIGQFQNDAPVLGGVLAIGQILAGGTSVVLGGLHAQQASIDVEAVDESGRQPDAAALSAQLTQLRLANNIAFGTFAVLAVGGIVEAQLSFVPERVTIRQRPLPPRLRAAPRVSAGPGGLSIGLGGTF